MHHFGRRVVLLVSLTASATLLFAADALTTLGVAVSQAKEMAVNALVDGSVPTWQSRNQFKGAAPAARVAMVSGALQWAKAWTATPEFRAAYNKVREERKPGPLAAKPAVDDELKQQNAQMQAQIAEMRKNAAQLPADQRKQIEEMIKQITASTAQQANDPEMQKMRKAATEASRKNDQEQQAKKMSEWQTHYPAEPKVLLAQRLHEFLAASANVDFNAKLVKAGTNMQFANPAYEAKPSEWKVCYRAGKPVVDGARTFATQWLGEIEKK